MNSKPAVTIYEVARHIGVSPAAVSSVLSNHYLERRISEKTANRIRKAIKELGYVPNMAGRRLRTHRPLTRQYDIAILTSFEAPLPLVGQALHAIQKEADKRSDKHTRYAVAIEMFHAGKLAEKPGLLESDRYHGIIITNTLPADDRFLATAKFPYASVVLGRRIEGHNCVLEIPNFVGKRAAEVLIDAGCRNLAVIHGKALTQATSQRVAAFKDAAKAGKLATPAVIECDGLQPRDAVAALDAFLGGGGRCDGVFAVTDSLAVGVYRAFQERGLSIPNDAAVVGVGDHEIEEFFNPSLSTLAGANDTMVAEAIPLLFNQLSGKTEHPQEILVVPPVYLRESTNRSRRPRKK
ncbi:LacI family DNA-binding transcriptional regulator [Ereboglobus luteus]|uniref:HTH lacI-type domain-containing protein n=1 Tax=Ereboglobus luteus TaxID=1796921 RepID=A0A2U8E440_9BACT|nr:LacI family DNA-binding transcriptional regulator [Ereboglobus luteus]AWI09292.1 hypothetical protein CKA38_08575 [Ereboglobus luteus]